MMEDCGVAGMALEGFADVSAMLSGGVYALVHRGVVVYVGKSKVMLGRVYTHRVQWGQKSRKAVGLKPIKGILFDAIWVRPCGLTEIDELESKMINLYKPRYNDKLRNGLPVDIRHILDQLIGTAIPAKPEGAIRRRV